MSKNGKNNVDIVSAGLGIMIIGLLTILLALDLADFLSIPGMTFLVQDKVSMISDTVSPDGIKIMGILVFIIGTAVFLRNLINAVIDCLMVRFGRPADNQAANITF